MDQALTRTRHAIGVMTGTSIDGIDAALVRIDGAGLEMRAALVRHISRPLDDLASGLRAAARQEPMTAGEFAKLAWQFGELHAAVIEDLMNLSLPLRTGRGDGGTADDPSKPFDRQPSEGHYHNPTPQGGGAWKPDLICVHGQTVFHQPPISWQLLNPAPIAQRFQCPVVSDLRQADLAVGGQGAPITPLADWVMFRHSRRSRAIVNLGGFCNITILARHGGTRAQRHEDHTQANTSPCRPTNECQGIHGFDLCPCNQVLDAAARLALGQPLDINGAAAQAGIADPEAVNTLIKWFNSRRGGPQRSLGTGDEAAEWVNHHLGRLSAQDLAASAANAIGGYIATTIAAMHVDEVILAGGGTRNRALTQAIASIAKAPVKTSDDHGVPVEARESMAIAILGALCADGVAISLPQVTGCPSPPPIAGVWSMPGANRGLGLRGC